MVEKKTELTTELKEVGLAALETAKRWTEASTQYPTDRAAKLLSEVLKDPAGLDYTVAFVDQVVRPEDETIAARNLAALGAQNPGFIPWYLRLPARLGGAVAPLVPSVALPAARKVFSQLVGDLVVDVTDAKLGPAIKRLRKDGSNLNVNLLGEAVLGDREADKRLAETKRLLERDDIDYVSLKVSAVTGPHNAWAFEQTVDEAVEKLLPLYQVANNSPKRKFINLDMEEYRDLELTIAVFKKILDRPEMLNLEAGIVLQAYLPDALEAMQNLQNWAAERRARGGAGIKVRVVKGANLAMERVESALHDWPLTVWGSKQATDANYMRVLAWAMTPERLQNVRLGVAGHNLFTIAFAWELAKKRGVTDRVEIEMLSGMATAQAAAVRAEVGQLLLYVPVVHPAEYDVAISYLVRRLEENAAPENFMSNVFDLATNEAAYELELRRFEAALACVEDDYQPHNRTQDRNSETLEGLLSEQRDAEGKWIFKNTPDTDPALPQNLQWAEAITQRFENSQLGIDTVAAATVESSEQLSLIIENARKAQEEWVAKPVSERVEILHRAGGELALIRDQLIEVAGSECGKNLDQTDVEVSEAIDFAHYYATLAEKLGEVKGATFKSVSVTAVVPPWNFPIAIPAGGVLAALAAGSAVIFKPARVSARCGALVAEALWKAGVPRELLALVSLSERHLGKELMTNPLVERVVLTGASDTAKLFRSWRPDLGILAETSGKNAIIVTPSADLDLAVKDVVYSAFGHAGQKCSAASLVILVGSVARSRRFARQLADAVKSLHVAYPTDSASQMGPIIEPPTGKLLRGLTELGEGERWVVKPEQLDESGKLWSPGVRIGVAPGSEYHLTEYFGPILGIMEADTLEQAIQLQNATAYGLTAGIHSLDEDEINYWVDTVEAGNLYINRGITGAIVRRQPFGGWKRSAIGNGTKAGGPNYLFAFGSWAPAETKVSEIKVEDYPVSSLYDMAESHLTPTAYKWLGEAYTLDAQAVEEEFGVYHDPSQISIEKNVLRYLPLPVTIRLSESELSAENHGLDSLLRVVGAGLAVGASLELSTALELPTDLHNTLCDYGVKVTVETDEEWYHSASQKDWGLDGRIRLIGGDAQALSAALDGSIDVAIWSGPVTPAGRVEILPFLHEQSVSFTNHRFGNRTPLSEKVL
ncbi:bifunctional proline dehydrogenase/L-glutamate gamma-semialdehyde dehydrogenase [Actinomycetaceae bacterium TAE3-ERU4]|nr:bifunctional proline dehydrogenase/L-glutamate gamma-semialdehyde dehydrogenase [Actinomycetaceae bacterium TAE3-ERU4]